MYDLVGRVKSVNYLTELGAELLESSMLLGDNAYDIIPGFIGSPAGGPGEFRLDDSSNPVDSRPLSEEDLLLRYLVNDQGRPSRG